MCRRLLAQTKSSAKCTDTPTTDGQLVSQKTFSLTSLSRMRLRLKAVALWGIRVIIPAKLQSAVLQSLHLGHPGITGMKAIACSYFWWTGLDQDIGRLANSCESCQAVKSSPAVAPLHTWAWPDAAWKRLPGKNVSHRDRRSFEVAWSHSNVQHNFTKYHWCSMFPFLSLWPAWTNRVR